MKVSSQQIRVRLIRFAKLSSCTFVDVHVRFNQPGISPIELKSEVVGIVSTDPSRAWITMIEAQVNPIQRPSSRS